MKHVLGVPDEIYVVIHKSNNYKNCEKNYMIIKTQIMQYMHIFLAMREYTKNYPSQIVLWDYYKILQKIIPKYFHFFLG